MSAPSEKSAEAAALSTALRTIRRRRGLKASAVAQGMGMGLRAYQYLEAGDGPWDLERIRRFALVTDSDPYAIVAAVMLNAPGLALSTMENKAVSIMMIGLQGFEERLGMDIARIDVRRLIAAFRRVFAFLESDLAERDAQAAAWLTPNPKERDD